jgi:cysteine sulfinate desulfinase/cysteine desulfurase-like protein
MSEPIYLDSNRTTPICKAAFERLQTEESDQAIRDLLGLGEDVAIGLGTSEELFLSVWGKEGRSSGKSHFIGAPKWIEAFGAFVKDEVGPKTVLESWRLADPVTGVIRFPTARSGVLLHVDVTEAVGKMAIDFPYDFLTFRTDVLHAIPGLEVIVSKTPLLFPLRRGPLLASVNGAASQALFYLETVQLEVARLRNKLEEALKTLGATIRGSSELRLPHVVAPHFAKIHPELLYYSLRRRGIHLHPEMSFALSRMTTEKEVDRAIQILQEVTCELEKLTEDLYV